MENTTEFRPWPKLSRWSRDVIISEKLDGTSSCVVIKESKVIAVQSRNRFITPEDDNYGFAGWVERNKPILEGILGDGYHYGEWWGNGIQRGYNMAKKKFSLFNVSRWSDLTFNENAISIGLDCVPLLWQGSMDEAHLKIQIVMQDLQRDGSVAAKGYMNPEGVVLFHTAGGYLFKKTFEKDQEGKGTQQ